MPWLNKQKPHNTLAALPPRVTIETTQVLKKAIIANKYLAELKGSCLRLPNPDILLNTIILQESKDSSAIENIVTTQDALYQAVLNPAENIPSETKEVLRYREAIYTGQRALQKTGLITGNTSIAIMQLIKQIQTGYRKLPGTQLANPITKEIIYTPPESNLVAEKMFEWEKFVNEPSEIDPVIRMALMHYQFEAIHPFSDGNGRTGRILNVLFFMKENLLTLPVLYHSSYIIQHKTEYYTCLRDVTENDAWEQWILFMLQAVQETSLNTLNIINNMLQLKEQTLKEVKKLSQKLPAYELNELIFSYPYIKIKVLEDHRIAKRQAASVYLQQLSLKKILKPLKLGREMYYINDKLMAIITNRI